MKKLEKNWLEWCVFGVGSVLVLATIGYLLFEAMTSDGTPPVLEVRLGTAERRGDEFAVPVMVINSGDRPAEMVQVEVRLATRDGVTERAELQIQLLPGGATRNGYVNFQNDPRKAAEISGRAVGFETP
jgi:uncharacterized protein (TIGR02588 family)